MCRVNKIVVCLIEVAVLGVLMLGTAVSARADVLYWSSTSAIDPQPTSIKRAESDGTAITTVQTAPSSNNRYLGVAVDPAAGYVYAGDWQHLFRTNLDGSGRVDLVSGFVADVELDLDHGKVYWTSAWQGATTHVNAIWRANLDGTNAQKIVDINDSILAPGIAVDPQGGKIYWSYWGSFSTVAPGIYSANLDGTDQSVFRALYLGVNGDDNTLPQDVEIDTQSGKLYWSEIRIGLPKRAQGIFWANLDGSGSTETVFSPGFELGNAMSFDSATNQIFFSGIEDANGTNIYRINADGTGLQTVLTDANSGIYYIQAAAVPEPSSSALIGIGAISLLAYTLCPRKSKRGRC